ncbi:sulfite:cytochrome C oxidoreductase subunit B [Chromobacterium phragmitis]|uniref:cytochrome c n=1 Tax=Chromobacterium phragmitis TaxID=2202141 RepID=UPI000DEC388A|nr:cytochrome c [Chromobacterium phragmitis]AXE29972.1 sulfite:cytochrome C oxidoreductase subunit B [Chromobacterium phragmitis]
MRAALLALASLAASAGAVGITLPNETAMLPDSGHPGYLPALQRCMICHSADYIALQPDFDEARWRAVVDKMRQAFKAPIPPEEVAPIAAYLADAQRRRLLRPHPP